MKTTLITTPTSLFFLVLISTFLLLDGAYAVNCCKTGCTMSGCAPCGVSYSAGCPLGYCSAHECHSEELDDLLGRHTSFAKKMKTSAKLRKSEVPKDKRDGANEDGGYAVGA